jgi:lipopolysaccharide/colanic/teichoic acid biosynthesis glycosyltransferase
MVHNNLVVKLENPLRAFNHDGYSFLEFHDEPLEDPVNRSLKRMLDLAVAVPVVVLLLPPLAILVKLAQLAQSPGPIFYRQVRTGKGGRPFSVWKFRTMHGLSQGDARQARKQDSRIYPFGRMLRRTSLDELPQFLNVVMGEMSVVGPRPHFEAHEPMFARSAEVYRMRFFVAPGITGLAQSRGFRGEATSPEQIKERIRLDLIYVRSWSIWLDLAIMARTLGQMLRPPESAY